MQTEVRLVGRDAELERLAFLLAEARDGRSGTLVIRGDPGIGKTALLEAAIARADGMTVLRARGVRDESHLAYSGLQELLRPLTNRIDEIPAPQAAALSGALTLSEPVPGDPTTAFAGTLSVLAAAAEDRPVLATIDDTHWLDSSSLAAVLFAARRLDADRIALVLAVRADESERLPELEFPTLNLEGLAPESAGLLLESEGVLIASHVAQRLLDNAEGNPLAILEIPRSLSAEQLAGREPLPEPLPAGASIERIYAIRIADLSPETRAALLVVAASEHDDEAIAAALLHLELERSAMADAERAGLVMLGSVVRFRHPLARSAVYHAARPDEQRRAHLALAAATDRPDRRAWHLAYAADGPDEEVAGALELVGLEARSRGGRPAAAAAFERAAVLSPGTGERLRRAVEAAEDWLLVGDFQRARGLLDEVLPQVEDLLFRAHVQTLRGRVELMVGGPMAAHALLVEEANRIEETHPNTAAGMLAEAAFSCYATGHPKLGLATAEQALEVAQREPGTSLPLVWLTYSEGLFLTGDARKAETLLDQALPMITMADLSQVYELMQAPALSLIFLERFDESQQLLDRVISTARERSAPIMLPLALGALGMLAIRMGDWTLARASLAESIELGQQMQMWNVLPFTIGIAAQLAAVQGRESECRELCADAYRIAGPFMSMALLHYVESALGLLSTSLARYDEAVDHLEPISRSCDDVGLDDPAIVMWAPDLIEAYVRTGRVTEAQGELAKFVRRAEHTQRPWALAAAARCEALLAEEGDFQQEFEAALTLHDRCRMPFERARTQLVFGERLRRSGRRSESRAPLHSALRAFEALGAEPWVEHARSELRATGERPRRREPHVAEQLTPHELQVALVVAGGLTNREVALQLFLSPKTIDFHLRNIYRKLDIRSRTELANLIAQNGGARTTS